MHGDEVLGICLRSSTILLRDFHIYPAITCNPDPSPTIAYHNSIVVAGDRRKRTIFSLISCDLFRIAWITCDQLQSCDHT